MNATTAQEAQNIQRIARSKGFYLIVILYLFAAFLFTLM
jgi:hypothetical protein